MTDTEICRANSWLVGDVLKGAQGNTIDRIVITAIGRSGLLAIWENTWEKGEHRDYPTTLACRQWKNVGHMDPFAEDLVWPE
jgi:hypothetical protein